MNSFNRSVDMKGIPNLETGKVTPVHIRYVVFHFPNVRTLIRQLCCAFVYCWSKQNFYTCEVANTHIERS